MIFGPNGTVISEVLRDEEGIVYADIDLARCVVPKQFQDVVGYYNRFDVFELRVNRRALAPASFHDGFDGVASVAGASGAADEALYAPFVPDAAPDVVPGADTGAGAAWPAEASR